MYRTPGLGALYGFSTVHPVRSPVPKLPLTTVLLVWSALTESDLGTVKQNRATIIIAKPKVATTFLFNSPLLKKRGFREYLIVSTIENSEDTANT